MDITEGVNDHIRMRKAKTLVNLFKLNNKIATRNLNKIVFTKIIPPFDIFLVIQSNLNNEPLVELAEQLIVFYKNNMLNEEWSMSIFEIFIHNFYLIGQQYKDKLDKILNPKLYAIESDGTLYHANTKADLGTADINKMQKINQDNLERIAKTLQCLFKEVQDMKVGLFKQKFLPIIYNYLVSTYDLLNNKKMIDNLFSVFKDKISFYTNKDKLIFKFLLGQYFMRKDKYKDAFLCFFELYKLKNTELRNQIVVYLFFSGLYVGKYLKNNVLKDSNCNPLIRMKQTLLYGKMDDFLSYNETLKNNYRNFYRFWNIEVYYLKYRIIIKNVCDFAKIDHKLFLNDAKRYLNVLKIDLADDELHCIVLNLIQKGHIKGYLNLTKNVIVMSKENPFPCLL
ncbi:hypothetical protein COBT_002335 [Conglomerata obtusa]